MPIEPPPTAENPYAAPAHRATDRRVLRVLTLPREGVRPLFYYEPKLGGEPDDETVEHEHRGGIRGWAHRLVRGIKHAEQHAPGWLKGPIDWVRARLPADERLMRSLRTAGLVVLVRPPSLPAEEAEGSWWLYLRGNFRRHLWGVIIYTALLAPSTMLTLLPGPNVVGIWVAIRLVVHGLALYGIVRARRGYVGVEQEPDPALEGPVVADRREAARVQRHYDLKGLKGRLKRDRVIARLSHRRERAERRAREQEESTC